MNDPDAPRGLAPIVGVGASAGGIEALQQFFGAVPADIGMAFVVILHLDPDRESRVTEILERAAPFPVSEVTEPVEVRPGRAYVIAPHTQLELEGDRLVPKPQEPQRPRHPIDSFFRSLSEERGPSAIGVVLSGTGADGSHGLRWIRQEGGITVAQRPRDATYPGMPESAISAGVVELVLPVHEIPRKLAEVHGAKGLDLDTQGSASAAPAETAEEVEAAVERIVAALKAVTGRDFGGYKRSTFLRRIDRRMRFSRIDRLDDYVRLVGQDADEARALGKDLLISVSRFFRDGGEWELMEERVVPKLFAGKGAEESVRVWVPGCGTGEEAYSLSMLLHEYAADLDDPPRVQIFATDIDEDALRFARAATYPESIAARVGEERIQRFFERTQDRFRLRTPPRESVLFAAHDLLSDPPFSRLDLVSCRNVLIYLRPDVQKKAMERMHYALNDDGFLFLGTSESADSEWFERVSPKHRVFRRRPGRSPLPLSERTEPAFLRTRAVDGGRGGAAEGEGELAPDVLHGKFLGLHGPPSAIVDDDYRIVHLSRGMDDYLRHPEGTPTDRILELVSEPVELELRTALYRAFRHREPSTRRMRVEAVGGVRAVEVEVRPGSEGGPLEELALVVFRRESDEGAEVDRASSASVSNSIVRELEEELRTTKEHLRATIDEREASIEELQSANEELQSVNEEQQAAREELESRREELQSMNEELATVNDEHRNKIDELDEVNADLRNLMASTEIATVFLNPDLEIRRFTPAAADVFNLKGQDEGRVFSDITHQLQDVGDLVDECRTVLRTGEPVEVETWSRDDRWYVLRFLPYRTFDDRLDGVVLTCYDLTDRKRIEEDLREARDRAREAERAKSAFVATVSHEIRTPLNALLGYVQLLGEKILGALTDEQSHALERMEACARHLDFMIAQVLTFSRMEEGRESVRPQPVDAGDVLRDVSAILRMQADEKGLALDVAAEADAEERELVTDVGKLRQILLNLGGNAVKFTSQGEVRLRFCPDADQVVFEVRDTGVGIEPEHVEQIFQRFWQGRQSERPLGQHGTGLGLAVTRGLVALLGGRIEVESEVGVGSTFRVWLPRTVEAT